MLYKIRNHHQNQAPSSWHFLLISGCHSSVQGWCLQSAESAERPNGCTRPLGPDPTDDDLKSWLLQKHFGSDDVSFLDKSLASSHCSPFKAPHILRQSWPPRYVGRVATWEQVLCQTTCRQCSCWGQLGNCERNLTCAWYVSMVRMAVWNGGKLLYVFVEPMLGFGKQGERAMSGWIPSKDVGLHAVWDCNHFVVVMINAFLEICSTICEPWQRQTWVLWRWGNSFYEAVSIIMEPWGG